MRAAIFDAPFSIRMAEAPKPEPRAGEVLVRVKAAGLCAGDLYIYTGKNPYVTYPRIGCHEIAGVVEAYGPGTTGPASAHASSSTRSSVAATAIPAGSASAIAAPTSPLSAFIARAASPIS